MKIKNSPRHLQNLPHNYSLDTGDYQSINKYREEKAIKNRIENKKIEIIEDQIGFNRSLNFFYNPISTEEDEHVAYFYTNPNTKTPNNSEGEIAIVCNSDEETVFIGIGSKEQYLRLCEIIHEINQNKYEEH